MNIKEIFKMAVEKKASDIHFVSGQFPILRIDGDLEEIKGKAELSGSAIEQAAFSLITEEQKKTFIKNRELDFSYENDDNSRFRVNLHFEKNNIGLVARVISDETPTLEKTDMPKLVYDLMNLKQGLVLVTGPTGCGKSTSLAAMVNYINSSRKCSIVTLEDPIEYVFKSDKSLIIQRQLGNDMNSFANGLKHVLRQDPNVIMVGEMRDLETIAATITLAETGHLVLATLHTPDAPQTVERIIDVFPPHQQQQVKLQLADCLQGVVSQLLLPHASGQGRVLATEIMTGTPAIRNLIREQEIEQIPTIMQTGAQHGMKTMDKSLKELFLQKSITLDVAMNKAKNLDEFKQL